MSRPAMHEKLVRILKDLEGLDWHKLHFKEHNGPHKGGLGIEHHADGSHVKPNAPLGHKSHNENER